MSATMTKENEAIFLENVDDGTKSNPQRGYFAIVGKLVGPFTSEADAKEYLKNTGQ